MISRRQAKRAVELHGDDLSEYPNVVGIGVQRDESDESEPPAKKADYVVCVYVTKLVPKRKLARDEVLPGFVEIPARSGTHKVRVRVREIGDVQAQEIKEPEDMSFSAE